MKTIFFAALLTCASSAMASDWQYVGGRPSESINHVDFDSIATLGNYKKAWIRTDYFQAQETTATYPKKIYYAAKVLYYFDCKGKMLGGIQQVLYEKFLAKGDVVWSQSLKFDPKYLDDVVPDSVGETFINVVCGSDLARAKIKSANKIREAAVEEYINDAVKKQKAQQRNSDDILAPVAGT